MGAATSSSLIQSLMVAMGADGGDHHQHHHDELKRSANIFPRCDWLAVCNNPIRRLAYSSNRRKRDERPKRDETKKRRTKDVHVLSFLDICLFILIIIIIVIDVVVVVVIVVVDVIQFSYFFSLLFLSFCLSVHISFLLNDCRRRG